MTPTGTTSRAGSKPYQMVWLGQSARTTVVTRNYAELSQALWMASLGDAIHRPRMLQTIFNGGLRDKLLVTGPLMLDSGGFTMMARNGYLTVREVVNAFRATEADVLVSLDYPPLASDATELRFRKYKRTLENLRYFSDEVGHRQLAPVIHGLSLSEVEANCAAIREVIPNPDWVCLGGLVPLLRITGRNDSKAAAARTILKSTIQLARAAFPSSILHVLGVGSPRTSAIAFKSGANSIDSVGWRRAAGFGTIFLPGGSERFVVDRPRRRAASRKVLDTDDLEALRVCECPVCRESSDLEARVSCLAESYLARAVHNAWVLIDGPSFLTGYPKDAIRINSSTFG
jgi:tRNA-guanine family transglycosylase